MTLLSIREQEAVNEAVKKVTGALECLHHDHEGMPAVEARKLAVAAVAKLCASVEVATRDAIARQVMEENARLTHTAKQNHDTGDQMEWRRVATFIAEMPCE